MREDRWKIHALTGQLHWRTFASPAQASMYQHWMMTKETDMFIELGTVSAATKGFQPGVQQDPPIGSKKVNLVLRVAT